MTRSRPQPKGQAHQESLAAKYFSTARVALVLLLCTPLAPVPIAAQRQAEATAPKAVAPAYNPLETFAPLTLPSPPTAYRNSSGAPGPSYWQQRADYDLHATIDTAAKVLTGEETITYTNHSPDTLTSLWLHLEQNTYRTDARAVAFASGERRRRPSPTGAPAPAPAPVTNTEGDVLDLVELQPVAAGKPDAKHTPAPVAAHTVVADTRLQIQLPAELALRPNTAMRIHIRWHYTIPGVWGGRTSWGKAQQGEIYDIAQWYPRMCVYDDLRGWDTLPYLANEFYLEYGDFTYTVTVPANFLVTGSGELTNPAEVLSQAEQNRLAQAHQSDKTVMIRTADEAAAAAAQQTAATRTWRFRMQNTRDAVFSASPAFLWDAARMNIPAHSDIQGGQPAHTALAQSLYPVESAGNEAWGRSTEYLKDSVEHFSARWFSYPWPNAVNVAGFSSGMEYPGILFDGIPDKGAALFWVTAHEIGHSWFPMIVGSDERRDAWIDEGFNTFIDTFESDEFEGGIYGPKRDGEYAPDPKQPVADQLVSLLADPEAPAILTRADAIREKYRHPVTYFKSAYGLTLLREQILGPERFDHAFRKFIADWAFKHPGPSDFFRTMESEGGEDLSYFWRGWYVHNWQLDMAVTAATPVDAADSSKGVRVTVINKDQLVIPAILRVEEEGGQHIDVAVPAETWMQGNTHTFTVPTTARATSATIDPDHKMPDADRKDNTMQVK